MVRITTIVFDLGSVLIEEDWLGVDKEFKEKFGISTLVRSGYGKDIVDLYDEVIVGKKNMEDVFKAICKSKGLKRDAKELCEFYRKTYRKHKTIDAEMINLVKKLHRKFRLACLTDTTHIHFETHREEGILDLFDECFGSHQIGMDKRDKRTFTTLLKSLKAKPEEVLFIDDNIENVENAISIGINAILFKNFNQLESELKKLSIIK